MPGTADLHIMREREVIDVNGDHVGRAEDLYADELKAFAADGITELHTAFSRADGPKTYVQNLVAAQKDRVWSLIEQGAIIYVCGDGKRMASKVAAGLILLPFDNVRKREAIADIGDCWP